MTEPGEEIVQPFEAEVGRVLEIVINSLYKERDIFLRELISNASDASDKLRYESLSRPDLLGGDPELRIRLLADPESGLLTIVDNGIGMDRDDLVANLGTIARSGTARFLQGLTGDKAGDLKLIGQFGVGFYSVFMVADQVVVRTTKAGDKTGWVWASDGRSGFTVQEDEEPLPRGTAITLHLKDDAKDYLDEWKLRGIVRTYSDHIAIPILLEVKKATKPAEEGESDGPAEPQQVNSASALWTRPRHEITDEQYTELYHHVAHAFDEPFTKLHFSAEGALTYTALLYVPGQKPFDLMDPKRRHGVKLYVRRVFITDQLDELLPRYLRFVSGVVDSEDLQLNVNRETLQHGAVVARIRKALTRRVVDELAKKAAPAALEEPSPEAATEDASAAGANAKKPVDLDAWWQEFGPTLKEGLYEDPDNRAKLLEIARFKSTRGPDWTSLAQYVERMKPGQEAILTISGESADALRTSPQLEEARSKGVEVLLLDDPVDEFWLPEVKDYKGKPFKSLTRGEVDLSQIEDTDKSDKPEEGADEAVTKLVARLKLLLAGEVKDVRTSRRLRESAVCLVAEDQGLDLRMERFLKQHNQLDKLSQRILEVNGRHELIRRMSAMAGDAASEQELSELAHLLLDQARIIEGEPIPDPGAFSRRMSSFLAKGLPGAA